MRLKPLLFTSIVSLGVLASPALADTVEILTNDGGATVHGTLIDVRDDHLVVRTKIGVISFERDAVECRGKSCPVQLKAESDMTIAAPAELANIFIPLLAEGYASVQETEMRLLDSQGIPVDELTSIEDQVRNNNLSDEVQNLNIQLIAPDGEQASNIVIQSVNSGRIFDQLSNEPTSLIFSERAANSQTADAIRVSGGGDILQFNQERIIAVDGYVIVAHPKNAVKSMSVDQISAVMSGQVSNWSEIGGPNAPINVYSFKPEAEAFHHINDLIFEPYGTTLTDTARIIHSNRELTIAIENDPNGVGFVSYSSVRNTRPIAIENECGMIVEPTAFNIKTEEYTLQNRITAYNRQSSNQITSDFLDFLDGPSLDNLVEKSGLISLSISDEGKSQARARLTLAVESSTSQVSSDLLQRFVLDVLDTNRLSTTFRFEPGSSQLDNKALRDLARVLRHLDDANVKRVVIAGFADANGGYSQNLVLSKQRADAALQELQLADTSGLLKKLDVEIRGYGELAPVACNTSVNGRSTNRRVEIWVN